MFFFKKKDKPFKLMVSIAAGENQIPLIAAARNMGYSVISIDQNSSAPGFTYSDIRIQESIENITDIYQKLRELLIDGKVSAVLTRSYGNAVNTTAELCKLLSIPFIEPELVDNFSNKKYMKEILRDNDILTPQFSLYNARKKKGYTFPCIVKPVIGHAKKGVRLINSLEEINKYVVLLGKKPPPLLIEEYIEGDELIVFGIIKDGTFYLYEITDKQTTPAPYFVDIMHSSPSKFSSEYQAISKIGQKIATAFSITCSPLVIELKHYQGEFYVLETVAEFGGEYIPEYIIPITSGCNFFEAAISSMTDDNFTPPIFKKNRNAAVVQFITGKRSKFQSYSPIDTALNNIHMYKIFKDSNESICIPKTNHDRVAVVAASGKSLEQAKERCSAAIKKINIQYK